ncbi:unnamed protein product [Adineta steineri]|uniref:Uncharacterized protein n=1 Tax=Adineta steineri TaxID=433720 RepID=A0A819Z780_9BILA|nr:unnamed protein product [Adineta steineri]CAF4164277.1 unnamed protein product [Adineta steineri]
MSRTLQLVELIHDYKEKISSKEYNIIFATHIAMVSREFSLKDEQAEEKFKNYSGQNFQIEYVTENQKMLVAHEFRHETCVITFQLNGDVPCYKQLEYNKVFDKNFEFLKSHKLMDDIRGSILYVLKRRKKNAQPIASETNDPPIVSETNAQPIASETNDPPIVSETNDQSPTIATTDNCNYPLKIDIDLIEKSESRKALDTPDFYSRTKK